MNTEHYRITFDLHGVGNDAGTGMGLYMGYIPSRFVTGEEDAYVTVDEDPAVVDRIREGFTPDEEATKAALLHELSHENRLGVDLGDVRHVGVSVYDVDGGAPLSCYSLNRESEVDDWELNEVEPA